MALQVYGLDDQTRRWWGEGSLRVREFGNLRVRGRVLEWGKERGTELGGDGKSGDLRSGAWRVLRGGVGA